MVESVQTAVSNGALLTRTFDGRTDSGLETLLTDYAAIASARLRSEVNQINDATVKALMKIADTKANVLVALKEASKTSDLILDRAKRIHDAYVSFRRGNLKKVAYHLGLTKATVHKTWLEYKYGWTPLLLEVKGAAELYAQKDLGGRPQRFTVTGISVDETKMAENGALEGWSSMSRQISYTRKCKIKVWCEVTNPHFSAMQQIGITNPLLYAWEVIPFSFVFDWFVSVGDYLTALTALQGITVRRSLRSFEKSLNFTRSGKMNESVSGGTRNLAYSSLISGDYRAYQRDAIVVDATSHWPSFGSGVGSFQRLASGLSLMRANSGRFS